MPVIDARYLEVLRRIYGRLKDGGVNWALTGSLSFALQGVRVTPGDIDVQTDEAGAYEIERRFSQCVVQPVYWSTAERIRSHFGRLVIDGVPVEIMGDIQKRLPDGTWEEPVDVRQHRRFVQVEDMLVPALSLAYEYRAYLILGRSERAQLLKEALQMQDIEAGEV